MENKNLIKIADTSFKGGDIQNFWVGETTLYGGLDYHLETMTYIAPDNIF